MKVQEAVDQAVARVLGPPLLYTVDEAAQLIRMSRASTYRLINEGALGSVLVRGSRRVPADSLTAFVAGLCSEAS